MELGPQNALPLHGATLAGIELYHMIRKGQNVLQGTLSFWKQFYALAA